MPLLLVGGANDNGIDLRGIWRPFANLTTLSGRSPSSDKSYAVIAQCKCYSKKLGPSVVRELEGTATTYLQIAGENHLESVLPLLAVLLSRSSFSEKCIARATASSTPMLLLHLQEFTSSPSDSAGSFTTEPCQYECHGALPNPALQATLQQMFRVTWAYAKRAKKLTPATRPSFWIGDTSLESPS